MSYLALASSDDGSFKEFVRTYKCVNQTAYDVIICIDGEPRTLEPGESAGGDCDGWIHPDGSATKFHGILGDWVREKKPPEWVKKHWPKCYEAASRRREAAEFERADPTNRFTRFD